MAPDYDGEKYRRAYDTALPLAKHLGVKIDKHWYVIALLVNYQSD